MLGDREIVGDALVTDVHVHEDVMILQQRGVLGSVEMAVEYDAVGTPVATKIDEHAAGRFSCVFEARGDIRIGTGDVWIDCRGGLHRECDKQGRERRQHGAHVAGVAPPTLPESRHLAVPLGVAAFGTTPAQA